MDYVDIKDIEMHDAQWQKNKLHRRKIAIPLYGSISCGMLKFINNNIEGYVEIPKHMVGEGDYFVLRTSGDSMIDAGIEDGNLIIVKKQSTADDGNIVAVMINNEVTLKRFFRLDKTKKYKLHPENSAYEDIIVDNCDILGVAVKILRNIK